MKDNFYKKLINIIDDTSVDFDEISKMPQILFIKQQYKKLIDKTQDDYLFLCKVILQIFF